MALVVPKGPYGNKPNNEQKKNEKNHNGLVSYKQLDSSQISHREIELLREQIWTMRHPDAQTREQLWPDSVKPKVSDLKGIATQRVFQWESDTTWFRAYEVEVHQFTGFTFILNFQGTTNHEIQGTFGVQNGKVEANLQPFELETICLVSRNKLDPFKFSVKMQYVTNEVHPAILQTALSMNEHRIKTEYDKMIKSGFNENMDLSEIKKMLLKSGLEFVDPDFYPSVGVLYADAEDSDKIQEEQVMWRRSIDFCEKPAVYVGGIDPGDVQQGRLGNCWFCCCLASMAERPEMIKKLIITKEPTKYGIWEVNFYHMGMLQAIVLDDYFPCRPFSGPIYTKTADDELWVAILEKAYAKLFGAYELLIAGSPYHALPDLTGNPAELYELHLDDHLKGLWGKLLYYNKTEDNLMSVACDKASKKNPEEAGLMLDHSYTVLDAKEGEVGGVNVCLLEIRNPWGHGEWKGDWSDFSPLWTNIAKKVFSVDKLDPEDGSFWMCWEDFLQYFTTLTVCYCRRDWTDARCLIELEFNHKKNLLIAPAVKLTVPQNGIIEWFGIYQKDLREKDALPYLDLALFIFKLENGNQKRTPIGWVGMEATRQVFQQFSKDGREFKKPLSGGTYLLVPFTSGRHWEEASGTQREIGISCHGHHIGSNDKMVMTELEPFEKDDFDQAILDMTMAMGDIKMWHDLERRHLRVGQMDLYVGRNNSKNKTLIFSMTGDLDNIYNAYNYPNLSEGCAFEMNPGQCAIFGVQVMKNPKEQGSSAYKFGLKSKPWTE